MGTLQKFIFVRKKKSTCRIKVKNYITHLVITVLTRSLKIGSHNSHRLNVGEIIIHSCQNNFPIKETSISNLNKKMKIKVYVEKKFGNNVHSAMREIRKFPIGGRACGAATYQEETPRLLAD